MCNVVYKTISKLLANRMKPVISACISLNQGAFVPGRLISDNVTLLREVLHSFNQRGYKHKDFCLKVDLSKAFDRMGWQYLHDLLPMYGFPTRFVNWIMACVRAAEFTLVLNGRGDGFFRPKCGLRQGCALSPYLFIIGMDLLSWGFQFLVQSQQIKGVRVAPSAQPLTNCIYADDLLVFGSATPEESTCIMNLLGIFEEVSGQRVGPDKSFLWFSAATPIEQREAIAAILNVNGSDPSPKYLGAPVYTGTSSHDFLIQRFSSRLSAWKSKTLSQAGRLVLIKATLASLPVYYMSTKKIPASVIQELTRIMRNFYWGKKDGGKYMAYISWVKICRPVDEGGLGVRDLSKLNDALLLKSLWAVAANHKAPWIDIVRAKYIPRSLLWLSRRNYRYTGFWRVLMNMRECLLPKLRWKLGNGHVCGAFGEPWFEYGALVSPTDADMGKLKVKDLLHDDGSGWDGDKLIQFFGYSAYMNIVTRVDPPMLSDKEDVLTFSDSPGGKYSVKAMFKALADWGSQQGGRRDKLWGHIWKKGCLPPRIKLFLWKLAHEALPLFHVLASRGINVNTTCIICNHGQEDAMHTFFQCTFARACWFGSSIPLRIDGLPNQVFQALSYVSDALTDNQWERFVSMLWGIWRSRNDRVYGAKQVSIQTAQHYVHLIGVEMLTAKSYMKGTNQVAGVNPNRVEEVQAMKCMVDGSWTRDWVGGVGFVFLQQGELLAYRSARVQACCPMQTEAKALLEAIKWAEFNGIEHCTFLTDCDALAALASQVNPPCQADWTMFKEAFEIWTMLKHRVDFNCQYIPRSQNTLADYLANKGRIEGWEQLGFTYPIFNDSQLV